MSYTYTKKDIQDGVDALNRRCGFEPESKLWSTIDGKQVSQVGYYHTWNNGSGLQLVQTVNDRGGHRTVLKLTARNKRELYNLIWAYIAGLDDGRDAHV